MTANRIREAALTHFAKQGYEGASLASIAKDVGIKKPSIYAHFAGKADLFLDIFQKVVRDELSFAVQFLDRHQGELLEYRLHTLLKQYKERYEHSDKTRFWMRTAYFPPTSLYEQVIGYVYAYLDGMEGVLKTVFREATSKGEIVPIDAERAATAFMCLLEGVLVEMLYGGPERFDKRLDAAWELFWKGLTKQ